MRGGAAEGMQIEARNSIMVNTAEDGRQVIRRIAAGLVRLSVHSGRRVVHGLLPYGFGQSLIEIRVVYHGS